MRYFIRTMFLTSKKPMAYFACHILGIFKGKRDFACVACRNLEVFKEYQDIGPTSYPNPSFNTFQNLGLFHKNLDGKSPCPVLFVTIVGLLKSTKILGIHRIVSTCQNLGVFHKNHFLDSKNPWPTFACQNLGIFEECKDFGPTLWKNSRFNTCRYLGVFLKNQVFDTKNTLPVRLVKILGF